MSVEWKVTMRPFEVNTNLNPYSGFICIKVVAHYE